LMTLPSGTNSAATPFVVYKAPAFAVTCALPKVSPASADEIA
jgi:hypothetical protein